MFAMTMNTMLIPHSMSASFIAKRNHWTKFTLPAPMQALVVELVGMMQSEKPAAHWKAMTASAS